MKLHLHIGHGKTGSSFLQSWLACNAQALHSRAGLCYPQRLPGQAQPLDGRAQLGQFSQGNGFVFDHLLQFRSNPQRQRRWLRRLTNAESQGLVFSFEGWARRFAPLLPDLQALIVGWELELVELLLVVRDPLEHACSAYSQMVKRHGYCGSLDDWLASYRFTQRLLDSLDAIAEAGPQLRITVAHYGREHDALLPRLQHWLNLDPSQPWQQPAQMRVNRSLSLEELQLMRHLNSRMGDAAARVGEFLVDRLPGEAAARLQPSQQAVEAFQARWREPVAQINHHLPVASQLSLEPPVWMAMASSSAASGAEPVAELRLSAAQLDCLVDGLWQPGCSDDAAAPG